MWRKFKPEPHRGGSERDRSNRRVEGAEIVGIGRDDVLFAAARTDHHMGINDVRRSARCEEPADVGRIHPVQVDHVGRGLADQPYEPDLPVRPPHSLRQRCRWNFTRAPVSRAHLAPGHPCTAGRVCPAGAADRGAGRRPGTFARAGEMSEPDATISPGPNVNKAFT